ncbi:MAG: hypothetical protein EHM12_01795 [Dehalococcoidia bacterium]|nr:MAG: hypothetical protein EHM12_01795 [Dehalococcoidia bacterium]
MDSQFRCGKCSQPISSKYSKCLACGSLGPHVFSGSVGSAIEGGTPVEHGPKRRDTYPAELVDRQKPHISQPPERFQQAAPADIPSEGPHPYSSHEIDDDSRFPAGMRHRSPILDYVEDVDASSDKRSEKRRYRKESDRDTEDEPENNIRYRSRDDENDEEDEEGEEGEHLRKPADEKPNNTLAWVIGIILVLALVIAAIYAINNYEELSKWLASPTLPEIFKPEE